MTVLPIEYFCRHFDSSEFDCGNDLLNADFQDWSTQLPDPLELVLLAAHEDENVRGFAALRDTTLISTSTGERFLYFFIAAFGIDQPWQQTTRLGQELMAHCYAIRSKRERDRLRHYDGTLVTSFYDPSLEPRYRALRFQRLAPNGTLWYRPNRRRRRSS